MQTDTQLSTLKSCYQSLQALLHSFNFFSSINTLSPPVLLGTAQNGWNRFLSQNHSQSRVDMLAHDFLLLVNEHFKEKQSIGFYALQLLISQPYLREICCAKLLQPPIRWIQFRLVLKGMSLLEKDFRSINEIAWDIGFEDLSYFIRLFRNFTGWTPARFRLEL